MESSEVLAFADLAAFSALASAALAALALDSLVVDLVDLVFNALAEGKLPALAALAVFGGEVFLALGSLALGGGADFSALAEDDPCFSALASALLKMWQQVVYNRYIDVRNMSNEVFNFGCAPKNISCATNTYHFHIIETYILADFAFDDLALLDLAALVVVLRCV